MKIKLNSRNKAVSSVIGIVLMVVIAIAIAAVTYIYTSGMMEESKTYTPGVVLRAESSDDKNYVEITVISTTTSEGVSWSDISGILINKEENTQIDLDDDSWKLTGRLTAGTIIEIRNVIDITIPSQYLQSNNRYQFSLVYLPTNGIMGSTNWVH